MILYTRFDVFTFEVSAIATVPTSEVNTEVVFNEECLYPNKIEGYKVKPSGQDTVLYFDEELYETRVKEKEEAVAQQEVDNIFEEIKTEMILSYASDAQALKLKLLYPDWKEDTTYIAGQRINYDGGFYKVLVDHTSGADKTPRDTPSLYEGMEDPIESWPVWTQPEKDSPYKLGDKVIFEGKKYESTKDENYLNPSDDPEAWKEV
jgi:hypothetical protein